MNRLSRNEIVDLFAQPLPLLGEAAHAERLRRYPDPLVTYVVDRNVNYTNACYAHCNFCAFYRHPSHEDVYILETETILEKVRELADAGGTQLLMQGGLHPKLGLDYACDLVARIRERFPGITIHSFSPVEIHHFAIHDKVEYGTVLRRLMEAGLSSLPGGGAEILVDEVRERLEAKKCTAGQWLEIMETAQRLGLRTTATMMFGHVESIEDRVEHLLRIRELQDRTGGFTAFIPWTYQPGQTKLGGMTAGGVEYLRTLAISRLALDNVPHIQASWLTQGLKICEAGLYFGADDFGGTLLEENVVRSTGLDRSTSEMEVREAIERSGFHPVKRDTQYRRLEAFTPEPSGV